MGNWCYQDRQQWKFVSRISSDQLNKAVLESYPMITLKEEDGTDYIYNFNEMQRSPSKGEALPSKIRCLSGLTQNIAGHCMCCPDIDTT